MPNPASSTFFGAFSLRPGAGGIARVARLMARVFSAECTAGRLSVQSLVLADSEAPSDVDFPVTRSYGSKLRFCLQACKTGLGCRRFIFDGCHLAQLHALPLLRCKPLMTYLHGIEVWEDAKAGYLKSAR